MSIKRAIVASLFLQAAIRVTAAMAQQYEISNYAGRALPPLPASAASVSIGNPSGITVDAAGNVYFVSLNCCIFKVDTSGFMTRIAGSPRDGKEGDGIPAIDAQIEPGTPAVDPAGNVFFAEQVRNRVRKISTDGILTTVAGTGERGYSGDGGPATSARLALPASVAVDRSGNLFIANLFYYDCNGNGGACVTRGSRISKVSPDGIITTVAGNGAYGSSGDGGPATSAALSQPLSIAVDPLGALFIADVYNNRVRKVSSDGIITTVVANRPADSVPAPDLTGDSVCTASSAGDGGQASEAHFCSPWDVAVDAAGNLIIAEGGFNENPNFPDDRLWVNNIIRKISPDGIISTVVGNGAVGCSSDGSIAAKAAIDGGWVAADGAGNILFGDCYRIRKVSPEGILSSLAGNGFEYESGDGGPATDAMLVRPRGAAVDSGGNLFLIDSYNDASSTDGRIRRVSPDGIITTVVGRDSVDSRDAGSTTSIAPFHPTAIAADGAGNLFVADYYRIRKVSPNRTVSTIAGEGYPDQTESSGVSAVTAPISCAAIAADELGNVFVADGVRIRKISPDGFISTVAGIFASPGSSGDGGPATDAHLSQPRALATDGAGNVFIADGNRIRKLLSDGTITTVAGNGMPGYSGDGGAATRAELMNPTALAADKAGNLLIADSNRIRRISADGIITTIAGTGDLGYVGDGGPAIRAALGANALAVDTAGNIYVVDSIHNAIRVLKPILSRERR